MKIRVERNTGTSEIEFALLAAWNNRRRLTESRAVRMATAVVCLQISGPIPPNSVVRRDRNANLEALERSKRLERAGEWNAERLRGGLHPRMSAERLSMPLMKRSTRLAQAVGSIGCTAQRPIVSRQSRGGKRLGSDPVFSPARSVISFINTVIGTYRDSNYREASHGFQERAASSLYMLVHVTVAVICIMLSALGARRYENSTWRFGNSRMSRVFRSHKFSIAAVLLF